MNRRDVETEILAAFDGFVTRSGRLPSTGDGKVNVAALCRELHLRPSDAQHLFRKDFVRTAINALAAEQDLLPIGARAERDAADEVLRASISRVAAQAKRDAQAAVEQSAAAITLMDELTRANAEIQSLRLEKAALEARLAIYEEGALPPWTG